jgi:hypothetical protein
MCCPSSPNRKTTIQHSPSATVPQRLMPSLMRRRCEYCKPERKSHLSPSRCLVHRTLSCTMFPSGPLVPSYFLAFLPSPDKIFFSGSLFHNCHGSSKSHTRRKRIPHHHRHRRLVTYLDRTSYICKTCHVLVLLRACRHKEQR